MLQPDRIRKSPGSCPSEGGQSLWEASRPAFCSGLFSALSPPLLRQPSPSLSSPHISFSATWTEYTITWMHSNPSLQHLHFIRCSSNSNLAGGGVNPRFAINWIPCCLLTGRELTTSRAYIRPFKWHLFAYLFVSEFIRILFTQVFSTDLIKVPGQ